ncbi:MAG: hypothetical protein NZL93_05665, partial [Chthoniobacterales bacterium]|nr:hypothetical protein [Chthoniobacterales bacterium]
MSKHEEVSMESELQDCFKLFRGKMEAAGCPEGAIRCFERSYRVWREGESGVLGEGEIEVVSGLEELEELKKRVTVEMS